MDFDTKILNALDAGNTPINGRKVQQPDIVGRLELLENLFLDGLQQIRQIKNELKRRLVEAGTLDRLLDAEELAQILNVEVKHIYALARDNRIPSVMIGKYRKFLPAQITKWLNNKSRSDC